MNSCVDKDAKYPSESSLEFKKFVQEQMKYLRSYGIEKFGKMPTVDRLEEYLKFVEYVHEGFGFCQNDIVKKLLTLESELDLNTQLIVSARQKRDKTELQKLQASDTGIRWRISICRKIADTLAWTILRQKIHIVRRFFMFQKPISLKSSNIHSMLEYVNDFNKKNPLKFVLISDLTSFIQIGDFVIIDRTNGHFSMILAEFKEGEVNLRIRDFLDFFYESKCPIALNYFIQEHGKKKFEQLERMVRQDIRESQITQIINTGKGIDPGTNLPMNIPDQYYNLKSFLPDVIALLNEADEKSWAIKIIENCLYIGAYKSNSSIYRMFDFWLKYIGVKFPRYDYRTVLEFPLSRPPFILPIPEVMVEKLIFADLLLLFCLDFNRWMALGQKLYGMSCRWLSKKKSHKYIVENKKTRPIIYDKRVMEIEYQGFKMQVSDGILFRTLYDFTLPSSTLKIFTFYADNLKNAKKENDEYKEIERL